MRIDRDNLDKVDEALSLSRILDWRFLLPDPVLEDVLYIGPEQDHLWKSIQYFCQTARRIPGIPCSSPLSPHRLVVIGDSVSLKMSDLNRVVRTGSWVFWQTDRVKQLFRHPIRCVMEFKYVEGELRVNGFEEIEFFWFYPDFSRTKQIIPLLDVRIVDYALSRGHFPKPLSKACQFANQWGLFGRLIRCTAIIARKG